MGQHQGKDAVLKAVVGVAPDITSPAWVDITTNNRSGYSISPTKPERTRNDGDGRLVQDNIKHEEADISFDIDCTTDTVGIFLHGGVERISYLYMPEGEGQGLPHRIDQTFTAVTTTADGSDGGVVFGLAATIEIQPVEKVQP